MLDLPSELVLHQCSKNKRAIRNNYKTLTNILRTADSASGVNPKNLRLVFSWKEIASAKTDEKFKAFIILALACLAEAESHLLSSVSGPNDSEMVAIFMEAAKAESNIAYSFQGSGLINNLQELVSHLIEADVL